jgi:thiosulfate dehydrogenase (quinone) large subunit
MAKKSKIPALDYVIGLLRIGLGITFLWAFVDKVWGLGFATCRNPETNLVEVACEKAWINGGSPTSGFLKFGTQGPFADFFQSLAGNAVVDWLFMAGLFCIGLALILGIGVKVAVVSGITLLMMMWLAALPPENNPFIDDHIIYSGVLLAILFANDNQQFGLGKWWRKQDLVKNMPVLE